MWKRAVRHGHPTRANHNGARRPLTRAHAGRPQRRAPHPHAGARRLPTRARAGQPRRRAPTSHAGARRPPLQARADLLCRRALANHVGARWPTTQARAGQPRRRAPHSHKSACAASRPGAGRTLRAGRSRASRSAPTGSARSSNSLRCAAFPCRGQAGGGRGEVVCECGVSPRGFAVEPSGVKVASAPGGCPSGESTGRGRPGAATRDRGACTATRGRWVTLRRT